MDDVMSNNDETDSRVASGTASHSDASDFGSMTRRTTSRATSTKPKNKRPRSPQFRQLRCQDCCWRWLCCCCSFPTTTTNRSSSRRNLLLSLCQQWLVILYGQGMSITLAAAFAALATLRLDCDFAAPTLSIAPVYAALSLFVVPLYWSRRRRKQRQQQQEQERQGNSNNNSSQPLALRDSLGTKSATITTTASIMMFEDATSPMFDDQQTLTSRGSRSSRATTAVEGKSAADGDNNKNDQLSSTTSSTRTTTTSRRFTFLGLFPLSRPLYVFAIAALLDLYAQIFVIWAFKYTTITSVAVMDALAIPSAMILSRFWLGRRYSVYHYAGVVTCMAGVLLNVFQDYTEDRKKISEIRNNQLDEEYPQKALGDVMAFCGGILFGFSNTFTEHLVRDVKSTGGSHKIAFLEYLSMVGIIATTVCILQVILLEREKVQLFRLSIHAKDTCSHDKVVALWMFFSVCCFVGYVGTARFLQISEAVFYNLSLLTGDFFCVGFQIFQEHLTPLPLLYPSLVLIIGGTLVYEMSSTSPIPQQQPGGNNNDNNNAAMIESIDMQPYKSNDNNNEKKKTSAELASSQWV